MYAVDSSALESSGLLTLSNMSKKDPAKAFMPSYALELPKDSVTLSEEAKAYALPHEQEAEQNGTQTATINAQGAKGGDAEAEPESKVDAIRKQIAQVQQKLNEAMNRLNESAVSSGAASAPSADTAKAADAEAPAAAPQTQQPVEQAGEAQPQSAPEGQVGGAQAAKPTAAQPANAEKSMTQLTEKTAERGTIQVEVGVLTSQLLILQKQLEEAVKEEAAGGVSGIASGAGSVYQPSGSGAVGVSIQA